MCAVSVGARCVTDSGRRTDIVTGQYIQYLFINWLYLAFGRRETRDTARPTPVGCSVSSYAEPPCLVLRSRSRLRTAAGSLRAHDQAALRRSLPACSSSLGPFYALLSRV